MRVTAAEKQAQIDALDQLKKDGRLTGTHSAYAILKGMFPRGKNPGLKTIGDYMRDKPDLQPHRMPASHAGEKNAVSAVIPPAVPLSAVFADTFFLAASLKRNKVYKACILYICALTKFVHLEPANFGDQDRPFSQTARDGCIRFIEKVRQLSGTPDLEMVKIRTDGGSEWRGAFKTWIEDQQAAHPGMYTSTMTSGSRASGNSVAERTIASIRRIIGAHFRSVEADWNARDVPTNQRRYNWTDFVQLYEDRYNQNKHGTIRARPIDAVAGDPPYAELQMRIISRAAKRYSGRVIDRHIPTKTSYANRILSVGDLVRKQTFQSGKPGLATLNSKNSGKASQGGNFSEQIFKVARVNAAVGNKQTTYILADLDDAEERGTWIRPQLLHIPPETLNYLSDDDMDDSDDDDDDEENDDYNDAATADPRPPNQSGHRFKQFDRLLFKAGYFRCAPGGLGALSNVMHDRQGVITELQRERPRGNRGAYMYEVKFDAGPRRKPSVTLDRLPARGHFGIDFDEDVLFLSEEL